MYATFTYPDGRTDTNAVSYLLSVSEAVEQITNMIRYGVVKEATLFSDNDRPIHTATNNNPN